MGRRAAAIAAAVGGVALVALIVLAVVVSRPEAPPAAEDPAKATTSSGASARPQPGPQVTAAPTVEGTAAPGEQDHVDEGRGDEQGGAQAAPSEHVPGSESAEDRDPEGDLAGNDGDEGHGSTIV
ncbi:MAG: hypothetical protein REI45_11010 [Propionicimonas sp.]|nr:hypothetical protein [Propionicimonas sp.]